MDRKDNSDAMRRVTNWHSRVVPRSVSLREGKEWDATGGSRN